MSTSLTQGLGLFVAPPPFRQVPHAALRLLRNAFVDTVACLISGKREPVTQAALGLALEDGSRAAVPVLMGAVRLVPMDAAFVNAVSAHALDYDDMALNGHPSAVLVPALLNLGQARHASDHELLRAYLADYEVGAALAGSKFSSLGSIFPPGNT